jgi:integrase
MLNALVPGIEEANKLGIYTERKTGRIFVQFNYQGQTYKFRQPKGVTRKQAEKFETKKKSELFFEAHGVSKRNETLYEQFVAEVYLPFIKTNRCENTFDQAVIICRSSLQFLKGRSFRSIKPADIEKFKSYRMGLPTIHGKIRSPSTIAKEISHISAVFTMAIKNDLCEYNPCSRIELPHFDNVQNLVLRREDEEVLFSSFKSDWARDVCKVILNTGLRQNDILGLTKFQVDWQANDIVLVQGKTKQRVSIPMNETVQQIIRSWWSSGSNLVFPSPKNGKQGTSIKKALHAACDRAKIPRLGSRDARRTFGTRLHELRYDDSTVAQLLGHRDLRSVHRYKRGTEIKRAAVNDLHKVTDNDSDIGKHRAS